MSWKEKLAILRMAGWRLEFHPGSGRWYMYRPNGSVYGYDNAKTYLVNVAFKSFKVVI